MTYDYSAMEEIERKESYYAYLNNSGVCITFANVYNQLLTQVDRHKVEFVWVKGHAGHPYNERCDALATAYADSLKK